jgi:rubrerythrin
MASKEDEELIARLLQEDLSNSEEYQEESFINYNSNSNSDGDSREREMQRQMDQVLETANLLRWEYENNLMNERIEEEKKQKYMEENKKKLEERRKIIAEQDREYEESLIKNKPTENPKPPEIPTMFICPISNVIMENPIYDPETNKNYEKSVLLKYLNDHNNKNQDGITINRSKLTMNNSLKQEIFYWKREHYK